MAVRAAGVRKVTSRMGGSLLMPRHVRVNLKESSAGWIAASVQVVDPAGDAVGHSGFADIAEGIEVLLRLTQDEEPLPAVFDATLAFLHACRSRVPHAGLLYQLCLLHLLGLLPGDKEMPSFFELSDDEQTFLAAAREAFFSYQTVDSNMDMLQRVRDKFLQEHLSGPLKAPGVAAMMRRE